MTLAATGGQSCEPVAAWTNLCHGDFVPIIPIVLLVLYVLWTSNFGPRAVEWCKYRLRMHHLLNEDEEKAEVTPLNPVPDGSDPSRSPTLLLQRFIRQSAQGHALVPPTALFQSLSPSSPSSSSDSSEACYSPNSVQVRDHELHARLRLARFRFPPREHAVCPVDIPDVFSSPVLSSPDSSTTRDVDILDEENDLILNPYFTHKSGNNSEGASFAMLNFCDSQLDKAQRKTPPPAYSGSLSDVLRPEKIANNSIRGF